jgi:hypothetical protein
MQPKRHLIITLTFALCLTVFAALPPHVGHAQGKVDTSARTVVGLSLATSTSGDTSPFPDGQSYSEYLLSDQNGPYVVPAGQRLVIESVNYGVGLPTGQEPTASSLQTTVNGKLINIALTPQLGPGGYYVYSGNLRAYADPGTSVMIWVIRNGTTGAGFVFGDIYGYLEPAASKGPDGICAHYPCGP